MASALNSYVMAIHTPHQLQHGGVSPNSPLSHAHSMQPSHEVAGHAAHNTLGTTPNTETKFLPLHVFNQYLLNPMVNNVPRKTPLQERRERSKQSGAEKTRRGAAIFAQDAVVPIAGQALTAEVSLALLMRDNSNGEPSDSLETALKGRKPNRNQRLNVYNASLKSRNRTDLSSEDANRVLQSQNGHEPRQIKLDPAKLRKTFRKMFPTWSKLRNTMQNPERVREAIDPQKLEKLKTATSRELRSGKVRAYAALNGLIPELTGLDVMSFFNRLFGPENCAEAMIEGSRTLRDGLPMKSRDVPRRNHPKYLQARSDARAFALAQTAFAFSSKLGTEIAAQARIAPALYASEIAVLLLSAAEGAWGKGMAEGIVKKIVGTAQLDNLGMSKVYLLVGHVVDLLPETAWAENRLSARRDLVDELKDRGHNLQPTLPAQSLKEERIEQKWQREILEKGKPAATEK